MKSLRSLEIIKNASTIYVGCASNIYTKYPFECNEIEKELKAIEIIRNKKVDTRGIIYSNSVEEYNDLIFRNTGYYSLFLTQQEYDLLKEVFNEVA